MKKHIIPLFLLILALSLLCGCTSYKAPTGQNNMMIVGENGSSWTINYDAKTISSGGRSYSYTVENAGTKDPTVTIYYPNGATYYENNDASGYTGNYDANKYASGERMMHLVRPAYMSKTVKPHWGMVILSLLCISFGIAGVVNPQFVWDLRHMPLAHLYDVLEPSEEGLGWVRFGGVLAIVFGVIIFFLKWN